MVGACCGFSTAVFLRYLNVLLKEFAHSAEMLATAVLTAIFFGAPLTVNVLISIFLVAIAIYLYNQPNPGFFFFLSLPSFFLFVYHCIFRNKESSSRKWFVDSFLSSFFLLSFSFFLSFFLFLALSFFFTDKVQSEPKKMSEE